MAIRRPLVIIAGKRKELPVTDRIVGTGSPIGAVYGGQTPPASATNFAVAYAGVATFTVSEANRQWPCPRDGVISALHILTNAVQSGTGTQVITLRVNGADTALTLTIGASAAAGTFTDLVNSVAVNRGDLIDYKVVTGTGTNASWMASSAMFY